MDNIVTDLVNIVSYEKKNKFCNRSSTVVMRLG